MFVSKDLSRGSRKRSITLRGNESMKKKLFSALLTLALLVTLLPTTFIAPTAMASSGETDVGHLFRTFNTLGEEEFLIGNTNNILTTAGVNTLNSMPDIFQRNPARELRATYTAEKTMHSLRNESLSRRTSTSSREWGFKFLWFNYSSKRFSETSKMENIIHSEISDSFYALAELRYSLGRSQIRDTASIQRNRNVIFGNDNLDSGVFTPEFKYSLLNDTPELFFSKYGTHFVAGYNLGGYATHSHSVLRTNIEETHITENYHMSGTQRGGGVDIPIKIEVPVGPVKIGTQFNFGGHSEHMRQSSNLEGKLTSAGLNTHEFHTATLIRGGIPAELGNSIALSSSGFDDDVDFGDWLRSVEAYPNTAEFLVSDDLNLVEIWELLPNTSHYAERRVVLQATFERMAQEKEDRFLNAYVYSDTSSQTTLNVIDNPADLNSGFRHMSGTIVPPNMQAVQVSDRDELVAALSGNVATEKYVLLTDNITLTGNWTPVNNFRGTLDGNGFTISGLQINETSNSSGADTNNAGMFRTVNGITIRNLTVELTGNATSGGVNKDWTGVIDGSRPATNAGALIGRSAGTVTIENVRVTGGRVRARVDRGAARTATSSAGGFIGHVSSGTVNIRNSHIGNARVEVQNHPGASMGGNGSAGGMIGRISSGTVNISNSYVGNSTMTIRSSSSRTNSGSYVQSGGFIGWSETAQANVVITNSYVNMPLSQITASGSGNNSRRDFIGRGSLSVSSNPRTQANTPINSTITDWDFDNIWRVRSNNRPEHRSLMHPEFAIISPGGVLPSFYAGTTLPNNLSGIMQIWYTDGRSAHRDVTRDVRLRYNFSTPGSQDIIIIYSDAFGSHIGCITVEVKEPTATRTLVEPVRTHYKKGTPFSLGGLSWNVAWSNGMFEIITQDYLTVTFPDGINEGNITNEIGEYEVFIAHRSNPVLMADRPSFLVKVEERELIGIAGIQTTGQFRDTYFVGQHFDTTGLTVIGKFDDDSDDSISLGNVRFNPETFIDIWQDAITITLNTISDAYYTIPVTVLPDSISNFIPTSGRNIRTNYFEGQTLSLSDLINFRAIYRRASTGPFVPQEALGSDLRVVFPLRPLEVSDTFITLRYPCRRGGDDEIFDVPITVVPEMQTGIEIVLPPDNISYIEGQHFDTTGMVVGRIYNSGRREIITNYSLSHGTLSLNDFLITITDNGYEAFTSVSVSPVPSISLNRTALTLFIDNESWLWAEFTGLPDGDITWESSHPNITSVDEFGMVTALSAGTAVITATTEEGGLKASCTVTVISDSAPLLVVENVTTRAGQIVEVPIFILNNPGISLVNDLRIELGDGLTLHYPQGAVAYNNGAGARATWPFIVGGGEHAGANELMIPLMGRPSDDNISDTHIVFNFQDTGFPFDSTENGMLITLRIKVDEYVSKGTVIPIKITVDSAQNLATYNITLNTVDGNVTVPEALNGDVNGDGRVDGSDVQALVLWINAGRPPGVIDEVAARISSATGRPDGSDVQALVLWINAGGNALIGHPGPNP
jgi:hypothetical protein